MRELLLRRKLDELDEQMVRKAENLVEDTQGITDNLEDRQIRNVLAVAEVTQSVAVVENFIKYQIGRQEGWRFKDFGEKLLSDLGYIKELAKKEGDDIPGLTISLVRRYLGYLVRYFKYVEEGGSR